MKVKNKEELARKIIGLNSDINQLFKNRRELEIEIVKRFHPKYNVYQKYYNLNRTDGKKTKVKFMWLGKIRYGTIRHVGLAGRFRGDTNPYILKIIVTPTKKDYMPLQRVVVYDLTVKEEDIIKVEDSK